MPLSQKAQATQLSLIKEPLPTQGQQVWLDKKYWLGRQVLLSLSVERASVTGLALSLVGYIPSEITRAGSTLVLSRVNRGLFGGSVLGPDLPINGYPIVSETDAEILVDLASPQTPYGLSLAGIYGDRDKDSSTELSPRFEYLKRVEVTSSAVSFTNVATLKSNTPLFEKNDGSAEALAGLDPYLVSLTTRTDWVIPQEAPSFEPLVSSPGLFGFFTTSPLVRDNGTATQAFVERIDASKPFAWEMSANTPDAYADAVATGLKAWNVALGSETITVAKADGTRDFTDPAVSTVVWDDNQAVNMAFTNWRVNPYTGQILQAQMYLSGGMWAEQAKTIYKLRNLEKRLREASSLGNSAASVANAPTATDPRWSAAKEWNLAQARSALRAPRRYFLGFNAAIAAEQARSGHWCAREPDFPPSRPNSWQNSSDTAAAPQLTPSEAHLPYVNAGVSQEQFQRNMVRSVVMHEAGHTLGLRHNFMGSLTTSEGGKVRSSSIMDYNDNVIDAEFEAPGDSDRAFIATGYRGVPLPEGVLFCTDQDFMRGAPYCYRGDSWGDPLAYLQAKEQTDMILAYRFALSGSSSEALTLLNQGVESALGRVKMTLYPTLEGTLSSQDANFSGKQKLAFASLQTSRSMYGLAWPEEIKRQYSEMLLQLFAKQAAPKAAQSALFAEVLDLMATGVADAGGTSLETRLSLIEGLRNFQSPRARAALKAAQAKIDARLSAAVSDTGVDTTEDEETRLAIVNLLAKGYFQH